MHTVTLIFFTKTSKESFRKAKFS